MSQIAVPSPGLFFAPGLLLLLFPFSCGLALLLMLHQLVAGAGAWLLIRKWGLSREAAAVAASVCALNGYMFSMASNYTLMAPAAWLPLGAATILSIDSEFSRRNMSGVLAAALVSSMVITAGRPEVGAPVLILLGLCAVWPFLSQLKGKSSQWQQTWLTIAWRLLPLILALAISSPAWLPAVEWARISPRAQGMDTKWVFTWSANWFDFLNLFLNHPMGDLLDLPNKYRNMVTSRIYYLPFLSSAYIGPAAFTLFLFGLVDKQWKERWLFLFLLGGVALMSAGQYTPFAPSLVKLSSAFAAFRYPVKLLVMVVLLMSLFAAAGANLILNKQVSKKVLVSVSVLWSLVLLAGFIMFVRPDLCDIVVPSKIPVLMREAQVLFGKSMMSSAALALFLCGAAAAYVSNKLSQTRFALIMLTLLAVPMVVAAFQYCRHWAPAVDLDSQSHKSVQGYFDFNSAAAGRLRTDLGGNMRFLPLYFDPLLVPPSYKVSSKWVNDERFYEYARQLLLANTHVAEGVSSSNGYEAAETQEYKNFFATAYATCSQNRKLEGRADDFAMARFCALTSTRVVLTQCTGHPEKRPGEEGTPVPDLDGRFFQKLSDDSVMNIRWYNVKQVTNRCRFAQKLYVEPTTKYCTKLLFSNSVLDTELDCVATMTEAEANRLSGQLKEKLRAGKIAHADATPACKIVSDLMDEISISTSNLEPGLLLLNDHFYPGWRAAIDGVETPILRSNVFARAVEVPSGNHLVKFSYQPESMRIGFILAGSSFIIAVLLCLFARRTGPSPDKTFEEQEGTAQQEAQL